MVAADAAMLRARPAGMAPNPARDPGRLSNPASVLSPMVTDRCGRRPCRVNTRLLPRRVLEPVGVVAVAVAGSGESLSVDALAVDALSVDALSVDALSVDALAVDALAAAGVWVGIGTSVAASSPAALSFSGCPVPAPVGAVSTVLVSTVLVSTVG